MWNKNVLVPRFETSCRWYSTAHVSLASKLIQLKLELKLKLKQHFAQRCSTLCLRCCASTEQCSAWQSSSSEWSTSGVLDASKPLRCIWPWRGQVTIVLYYHSKCLLHKALHDQCCLRFLFLQCWCCCVHVGSTWSHLYAVCACTAILFTWVCVTACHCCIMW
jgi:hypothetical protein